MGQDVPSLPDSCDLLVIGSGAGGLSAAVTAARLGLKVCVVEKASVYGGTTAWSGGWMWIPRNPLARLAGINEAADAPLRYLRHELGEQFDAARVDAFLRHGPAMVSFFQSQTGVRFIDGNLIPDFHGNSPDAASGGRSLCAAPFNGLELGKRIVDLRPPLPETTLWGMGIASGAELRHFLNAMHSWQSFKYVAKRIAVHLKDCLLHRRGMTLVNGHALVAHLVKAAFELGVTVHVNTAARSLRIGDGRVHGAVVTTAEGDVTITAAKGVLLACGGFPHDGVRNRLSSAHTPGGGDHWSAAPADNTGDGLRLGEAVGATVTANLAQPVAWAPVSRVPRADGSVANFPHLIERGKPGLIAVTRQGTRFTNEADPYYDFMCNLFKAIPVGEPAAAWLICDHRFIRRYGLGAVKPAPMPMGAMLRSGYLLRGATLEVLAAQCGIDDVQFVQTVAAFNASAMEGRDPAFGRGETPYNRMQGDASHGGSNPCVAPVQHGPFYAVKVVPGSLGTFAGLRTDATARVLDRTQQPIAGLYACGNDMASVMGGYYPSGGITLGPAMTFGYIVGHHVSGTTLPETQ